jgi:hypothetical protein
MRALFRANLDRQGTWLSATDVVNGRVPGSAEASMAEVSEPSLLLTLRWREMDSNYWSRDGETPLGRAMWFPRTAPPALRGTDPERDEKFESGFIQQRVAHEPHGQNRTRSRPEPKVRIQLSPAGSQARTVDGSEKARPLTPPRAPAEELMTAPAVPGEAPHRKAPNNRGPFARPKSVPRSDGVLRPDPASWPAALQPPPRQRCRRSSR